MLNLTTGFRIPLGFSRKRPWFSNPCRTHCWPQFFFKEAAEDGAAIMTPLGMLLVFSHGFSHGFLLDFPWIFRGHVGEMSLGKFHWASSEESWYHRPKCGFRQPRKWGYNYLRRGNHLSGRMDFAGADVSQKLLSYVINHRRQLEISGNSGKCRWPSCWRWACLNSCYPLVNKHGPWKSPIFNGN